MIEILGYTLFAMIIGFSLGGSFQIYGNHVYTWSYLILGVFWLVLGCFYPEAKTNTEGTEKVNIKEKEIKGLHSLIFIKR